MDERGSQLSCSECVAGIRVGAHFTSGGSSNRNGCRAGSVLMTASFALDELECIVSIQSRDSQSTQ